MTRTKTLLWCIGIVFLLCWIPINFINLLSDSLLLLNMYVFLNFYFLLLSGGDLIFKWPRNILRGSDGNSSHLLIGQPNAPLAMIKYLQHHLIRGLCWVSSKPNGFTWLSLSATAQPWSVQVTQYMNSIHWILSVISFSCQQNNNLFTVINPIIYGFFNENFKREFLLLKNMVR